MTIIIKIVIILLLAVVILLFIYKYISRRRPTKMFELFDQDGQDMNSDELSSYEDSTLRNDDLIDNGGLTQDPGISGASDQNSNLYSHLGTEDVTQTPSTNPAPNPFDIDNDHGADVNPNAQGETENNPFDIYKTDSSNQPLYKYIDEALNNSGYLDLIQHYLFMVED